MTSESATRCAPARRGRRLEELIGTPVALLSTSPEREDTVMVRDPFAD